MAGVPSFQLKITEQDEGGVYANILSVWHSPHEFTLDFAASLPANQVDGPDGQMQVVIPSRVVARVKIPPTVMFDVLRALNENMTNYEARFGTIRAPGADQASPLYPPHPEADTGA